MFSRICNSAEKKFGNLQFPPLKKKSHITFCRKATMRVANSRYNAAAELQIRQNKGGSKRPQVERQTQY